MSGGHNIGQMLRRVGVVITTHGYSGVYIRQCLECYTRVFSRETYIVLFINESNDEMVLNLGSDFPHVTIKYIPDQRITGGLTGTWNMGIDMCFANGKDIVILSNDDILFDNSVYYILKEACSTSADHLKYFGPVTNNPGAAYCNRAQLAMCPVYKTSYEGWNNAGVELNGFFMVFPKHTLLKNKYSARHYFDPRYPFGGNETEWQHRVMKKGGKAVVVPSTFIYHYKLAGWKNSQRSSNTCIYTINTGGYEGDVINLNKSIYDTLYFTDNFKLVYKCIAKGIIPFYVDTTGKEPKLIQRTIKTNVHNYLPHNYKRSVYVDGNLYIKDINSLSKYISLEEYDIICFKHPDRNNVSDECDVIIGSQLEKKKNIETIKQEFVLNRFEDNIGLTETNVLIRNHKNIVNFSKDWARAISICRRDQVSFDYLLYKHKIKYLKDSYQRKMLVTGKVGHINPINRTVK